MVTVNLTGLSTADLEEAVARRCSQFGSVKDVKLLPPANESDHWGAVAGMSNEQEAERVVANIGDLRFGTRAIITLAQDERSVPALLMTQRDAAHANHGHVSDRIHAAEEPSERAIDILLVEDNPADVRMAREALQAAAVPHHLHVVDDGIKAVSYLHRTREFAAAAAPDVVLLDLKIPRLGGHAVLREIRASDDLRHIPVVVLSGADAQEDAERSDGAQAEYYVAKAAGLEALARELVKVRMLAADRGPFDGGVRR